jgi:hypothetical protein
MSLNPRGGPLPKLSRPERPSASYCDPAPSRVALRCLPTIIASFLFAFVRYFLLFPVHFPDKRDLNFDRGPGWTSIWTCRCSPPQSSLILPLMRGFPVAVFAHEFGHFVARAVRRCPPPSPPLSPTTIPSTTDYSALGPGVCPPSLLPSPSPLLSFDASTV